MNNYCICCGAEIPEGRQICPACADWKPKKPRIHSEWTDVNDRLPDRAGLYLVATTFLGRRMVMFMSFAPDLYEIEKRVFKKHKPGWYQYSDARGFFEWTLVTHWMPMPPLPEELSHPRC